MSTLPLPPPPPPPPPVPPPDEITITLTQTNTICYVCGDVATIVNYGALSCLSCRTFFRRNAFPTKEAPACRFGGQCEVTMLTRRICTACRLVKCLAVGMSPDFIRKEDLTGIKRKSSKTQQTEHAPMAIQSALSVPHDAQLSYINASERTLISNVVHAFDTFSPVLDIRRRFELFHTTTDSTIQFDITQSLQITASFYNSLKLFISSTPDFQILTPAEQSSLFQRNMLGLLSIGSIYLMRELGIFDKPEHEQVILPLYGHEVVQQTKSLCQQMNCDPVLLKLLLVALAFSSNCYMIHRRGNIDRDSLLLGTFRLLGSQNVYVELMWKYLLETYSYHEAVHKFSTIIRQLLETLRLSVDIYENNQIHQTFIDDTIEQTEHSTIKYDQVIVPLWGKK